MHDGAFVAVLVRRPVASPVLAVRQQPAGRTRGPRDLPECGLTGLAFPYGLRPVTGGGGVFDEALPYRVAHARPCGLERLGGRIRNIARISVGFDREAVGQRTDSGGLTFPTTADPPIERILVNYRLDDPPAGLHRTAHRMPGKKRQKVRASPQIARAARLGDEPLNRADRNIQAYRHRPTSMTSVHGSPRLSRSRRRSRKAWIGRYNSSSVFCSTFSTLRR